MLYTRKGDSGTTKDFKSGPGERKSKSSCQTEALGALDELNSFLGLVKVKSAGMTWTLPIPFDGSGSGVAEVVAAVQNNLFSVQAEIAGADKRVPEKRTTEMEQLIDAIEKEMPPIKTFFVSGGTEMAALFDISRTLARKAERRIVAGLEKGEFKVDSPTLSFMNRLSSLLYALARLSNHKSGIKEQPPTYQ
jgi:cob(I)alamin adenosyltransferase